MRNDILKKLRQRLPALKVNVYACANQNYWMLFFENQGKLGYALVLREDDDDPSDVCALFSRLIQYTRKALPRHIINTFVRVFGADVTAAILDDSEPRQYLSIPQAALLLVGWFSLYH